MDLMEKILGAILTAVFAFYLLIYAFVPQLSDWASALSSVNGQDWSWSVYLVFLVLIFVIVYGLVSYMKKGKR